MSFLIKKFVASDISAATSSNDKLLCTQYAERAKTKPKPSEAGSVWKGGARERADDVFCFDRNKKRRSKADFAPTCIVLTKKMHCPPITSHQIEVQWEG